MLAGLEGLDHVVVIVDDLDRAAANWRSLGFTLSQRGTHSEHLGTGNYTIMFGPDYVELLGVLHDTPLNAPSREFLARRGEGVERLAFTTTDAALGVAALRANGIDASGPIEFSRPVELPGGGRAEAAFSVFDWPAGMHPGGTRIFACQHHTRDAVWIPELQRHANTASRIRRVEIVDPEPGEAAREFAQLIDSQSVAAGDEAFLVATGSGRADLHFVSQAGFRSRHRLAPGAWIPAQGVSALVLGVADPGAAARALGRAEPDSDSPLVVAADRANGVLLSFEAD